MRAPEFEDAIKDALVETLPLPRIEQREGGNESDLAIDLTVSDYDQGAFEIVKVTDSIPSVPLGWRPEITITVRVYKIDGSETVYAGTVKQKYPLGKWFRKVASVSSLVGLDTGSCQEAAGYIASKACLRLLTDVRKELY